MDKDPKNWYCLKFREFLQKGFDVCDKTKENLLISVRGMCMIDVFTFDDLRHIAFLDFDLSRPAALDSAFASPLIGLPFGPLLHRTIGRTIAPFKDLRQEHHVGFFIGRAYRNKGGKGFWNLDELMMAIALELAFEQKKEVFVIRPTDDKLKYYRRKFDAQSLSSSGGIDRFVGINIKAARTFMKHVRYDFGDDGRVVGIWTKCDGDML